MIPILEILPVLSVFPYALLYYAILLASVALALLTFRRANPANNPALRSTLLVIFFSQLFLLTLNLLIYQGFQQIILIFPIAFRAMTLVCMVWFVRALFWQPAKRPGWIIWVLTALILLAASILTLYWLPIAGNQSFNGTWQDLAWVGTTLLTITVGAIAYLRLDRTDRVEAVVILVAAASGFVLYLALPNAGSLPSAVMVSQMLYYPLLISLAWQRQTPALITQSSLAEVKKRELSGEVAVQLLDVSLQQTNTQIQHSLTHSLALYLMADLCGFLVNEPGEARPTLVSAYDLIREEFLGSARLSNEAFPTLTAHFEDREALVSNEPTELAQEKTALMELIGYNQIGNLLFYPLNAIDAPIARGLLCLSPYTERIWQDELLGQLSLIAPKVNEILDEAEAIEEKSTTAQRLQLLVNQVQRDRANTVEQFVQSQKLLVQLQQELQSNSQTHESEVELWLQRQETLEDQLEELHNTLRLNEVTIAQASALKLEKERLEQLMAQNAHQVEGLRSALDHARGMLEQMDTKPSANIPSEPTPNLEAQLQTLIAGLQADYPKKQLQVGIKNELPAETTSEPTAELLKLSSLLLQNAFAVSKSGSEIMLEVLPSEDYPGFVELRVSDAGSGLKPEDQTNFLANITADLLPADQDWGDVDSLREAVSLTQSLKGHWWIHSVPDTLTIHRLAIPAENEAGEDA